MYRDPWAKFKTLIKPKMIESPEAKRIYMVANVRPCKACISTASKVKDTSFFLRLRVYENAAEYPATYPAFSPYISFKTKNIITLINAPKIAGSNFTKISHVS